MYSASTSLGTISLHKECYETTENVTEKPEPEKVREKNSSKTEIRQEQVASDMQKLRGSGMTGYFLHKV